MSEHQPTPTAAMDVSEADALVRGERSAQRTHHARIALIGGMAVFFLVFSVLAGACMRNSSRTRHVNSLYFGVDASCGEVSNDGVLYEGQSCAQTAKNLEELWRIVREAHPVEDAIGAFGAKLGIPGIASPFSRQFLDHIDIMVRRWPRVREAVGLPPLGVAPADAHDFTAQLRHVSPLFLFGEVDARGLVRAALTADEPTRDDVLERLLRTRLRCTDRVLELARAPAPDVERLNRAERCRARVDALNDDINALIDARGAAPPTRASTLWRAALRRVNVDLAAVAAAALAKEDYYGPSREALRILRRTAQRATAEERARVWSQMKSPMLAFAFAGIDEDTGRAACDMALIIDHSQRVFAQLVPDFGCILLGDPLDRMSAAAPLTALYGERVKPLIDRIETLPLPDETTIRERSPRTLRELQIRATAKEYRRQLDDSARLIARGAVFPPSFGVAGASRVHAIVMNEL